MLSLIHLISQDYNITQIKIFNLKKCKMQFMFKKNENKKGRRSRAKRQRAQAYLTLCSVIHFIHWYLVVGQERGASGW